MQEPQFIFQSLVPVRATPTDMAEMVTQLLFGDLVEVIARDRKWLHVRLVADGYEGWIDEKAALPVDETWIGSVHRWEHVLMPSVAVTTRFRDSLQPLHLSLGARIPCWSQGSDLPLEVVIGDWSATVPPLHHGHDVSARVEDILAVSEHYLGAPYLWGGKSLWGIDCSGFIQMVHRICGIALPRNARQQVHLGEEVAYVDRKAGDLAFFSNSEGKVNHVGLILPDGNVRHASGHVHDALLTLEGIVGKYTGKRTHTLYNIKRIV